LQTHVPLLAQIIEQIDVGEADPQQVLPILQAFYQHITETLQFATGDPSLQSLVAQANQVLQYAEEAINNTNKALQKIQRDQAQMAEQEAAAGGQPAPPSNAALELKMQEHQMKMEMARQKAELDMQIKKSKFDQEQAIRDSKAALEFRKIAPESGQ